MAFLLRPVALPGSSASERLREPEEGQVLVWQRQEFTTEKGLLCCMGSPAESASYTHTHTHTHTCTHTHTHSHTCTHTHTISMSLSASPPACTGAQDGAVSQVHSQSWPCSSWHPPQLCEGRWCRGSQSPGLLWLPFPPMVGHSRGDPIGVSSTPVWPCSSLILPFEGAAPHWGGGFGCWPSWGTSRWSWLEAPWCPLTLTFLGTKEIPILSKPSEFAFWNLFLIMIHAYCRKDEKIKKI